MGIALYFIGFLILQRLVELALSNRNTKRLLAKGAKEFSPGHYPLIVGVHILWIIAIAAFGWNNEINYWWLAAYGVLQAFRMWILGSLGERWTTRIIILNEPLVRKGLYKYVEHPNYILVGAEIIIAPMVLGLWWVAILFTILNTIVLGVRVEAENKALATITKN